ncbi:MAG: thioredoxin domain-containing protein [Planctomycetales bacterium]|nr:thioredoxin domain-containing protein [Planctomycetales bacterium]
MNETVLKSLWAVVLVVCFAVGARGQELAKNELAKETSPYLLQHATNPVAWRPWGTDALAAAKKENKPILLSIGYSSCHWCHVMERESFVDKEIAKFLNEHFICIKVDREERPDIDTIYMTSLQVYLQMTQSGGNGGWPLTMFLTPKAEPFFGGTYFPARDGDRGAATGFLSIIKRVAAVWRESPEGIERDAQLLTRYVKQQLENLETDPDFKIESAYAVRVHEALKKSFDETHGGFGFDAENEQRPKFPEPSNLLFLLHELREGKLSPERRDEAAKMVNVTLEKMSQGGIYDHLGGGFHRYSVDRRWDIPHFEKMLYDNGLLASVYAEAYEAFPRETYARVLLELAQFVKREMTTDEGAFYSALDADSEHEEGKFYRWTRGEIQQALDGEAYQLAAPAFGLDGPPNFEAPYYALRQSDSPALLAKRAGLTEAEWAKQLEPIRGKLLQLRSKRVRPGTDFKVLTGWNGLMIRGLADSGRALKQPEHIEMARRAAEFLLKQMRGADGHLLRSYAKGEAKLNAYLDDYAYLVHGLIGLHRATGEQRWLVEAKQLTDDQLRRFWDERQKGFYFTSDDHESLLARSRNQFDGARPSGNAIAALNLLYLADALDRDAYRERARLTVLGSSRILHRAPAAAPQMAIAVSLLSGE